MADRPEPYIKKQPGDIMLAADWNEAQVLARADIETVRTQAINGARLEPGSSARLAELALSGDLKFSNGKSLLQSLDALTASIKTASDAKFDRSGGTLEGGLVVKGELSVTGLAKLGGGAQVSGPIKLRTLTTIEEGDGKWSNFGSNAYYDGTWRRVDNGRAGVNLHMQGENAEGQEFRFYRIEANGQAGNIAVLGSTLSYLRDSHLAIGSTSVENAESWTRVLDVFSNSSTKLSVRANTVDSRVMAHVSGIYGAPAGMVVGTRSAHPLSFINEGKLNTTLQTTYIDMLCSASGPLRISSNWTGKPDNNRAWAEISNDTSSHKTLMIIGNKANDGSTRRVSVWDRLEVNGSFHVNGNATMSGQLEVNNGVVFENNLGAHIQRDGVLYRYGGQAYIGVDDHLFVYDWGRNKSIHLDVMNSKINYNSDLRLKEDVAPLSSVLDTVRQLRGVSYRWKDGDGERQLGFIAQEVEAVLPELVSEGPNGMKQMSYTSLIPLLLEAVKAQQAQIDELKAR
ncbi:tail fiber domain-containing protein [Chitinolyticbacter albus]|uniref:tail fiber domain-containing protein n=1 Tax=Chitinolyticbacter albus TaxID=2961951 RepID=UPI0021099FBA|nr:tail fiber domain-containing protein [Chitinolyticbacter albus]